MIDTLRRNWRLYLFEGLGLAIFMTFAGGISTLLFHPDSEFGRSVKEPAAKYAVLGVLMFPVVAFGIAGAPWGKATGGHVNPAITLAFLRLGKISPIDALFYILGQFGGAFVGVTVVTLLLPQAFSHPAIHYGSTVPGPDGMWVAFAVEFLITFLFMLLVLHLAGDETLKPRAPLYTAGLVMLFLTVATPFTGMSMNPARTLGSAAYSRVFEGIWIYFAAPIAGTLLAAEIYRRYLPHRLTGPRYPPEAE